MENSLDSNDYQVMIKDDELVGRCLVLFGKKDNLRYIMDWFPVDTFSDLYKSNYLIKLRTGVDFIKTYPRVKGYDIQEGEDFTNMITDIIFYDEQGT